MKKFADFVAKNNILILIISLIMLIPAVYGFVSTKINYDILIYLPESVDTIKGQNILNDDFGLGAYAFVMVDTKSNRKVLNLEKKIRGISGVNQVISVVDVIGTTIPKEMLPDEVLEKLYHDDTSVIMVTFDDNTSSDSTVAAVTELRKIVGDASSISSMTSMVLDTRDLSSQEMLTYVLIAALLCGLVLIIATDSYVIPIFLLLNIGIAIIYNMGTNFIFGQISYITKSITAVLQLGVTTDFSIFLYHKYLAAEQKYADSREAMSEAIMLTFKSVLGSSLTTFVGFLALCTMKLTLGMDIGLVMAKGVLFGLICVLTVFPALVLTFDKFIKKTKHKVFLPKFIKIQNFSVKYYKYIFALFLILLIPAYIGNKSYDVYYKLDESLPADLPFHVANSRLAEEFNIISPEIIIIDKKLSTSDVKNLVSELENIDGIDLIMAPNVLASPGVLSLLPDDFSKVVDNDKYQLILFNSEYEIASDQLNEQVDTVNSIISKYDKNAILAGEGALMKDLVMIADHDFHMVNYTSIAVVFLVMLFVLKSFGLPIILIFVIEFAIFMNMAFAYYTGTSLPFIASIVVGTIQLGATIDYAILMSNTYLEWRHNNKLDKDKAIRKTLGTTVPSIITSALCFFAATIGVSLYTRIDMIGSICHLLSRGSIISMLVVILILPALLIIFDGFIMKTTKFKEEN